MDKEQVKKILKSCSLPDNCKQTELRETHISWVILTDNFAFKIKRPVKYSFVDFSSLEKRKFFCHEELHLNQRMEPDMYLGVLPVSQKLVIEEGETDDEIIDYVVKMKRMDNSREMNVLLRKNQVTNNHIDRLAKKIAKFHKEARVIKNPFRTLEAQKKFADILNLNDFVSEKLGNESKQKIERCVEKSNEYLSLNRSFSNERVISGFHRDCHGDLNSRNIFLYENPVVFDCIEFNSDFRQIDVLNDIAFLCVDLDFFEKENLSRLFYNKYLEYSELDDEPKVRELFLYYKSYRASVRAKVTLISAKNIDMKEDISNEKELNDAKKYLDLMEHYMNQKAKN